VQNNLITGGVDCDLSDIRDSWWLRFYSDVYWRPGKINLQSENGRKYVIHYALAQVAAGCDTVWYYRRLLDANKQSPFSLQNWAALIKETKDYVQRAYGRDILVSGIGAYNKYVDYQVDPLIEYFYCPNNNPYEGRPMFLTKKGVPYQDISNRAGFSKVYHLDCSQSKLSYLHMITFSRGISPRDSFRSGAWAQEDLKAAGFKYSGPKGDGTTYGIPILAFVDWPTPLSDLTTNIPEEEQMNFFYGMVPEMMAVGWRFCFPLSTYLRKENGTGALMMDVGEILNGESQESQAAKTSIYYKLRKLIDFYNYHSSFYQQQVVQWNEDPVEHDLKKIHAVDVTMTNVKNISYVVNEYRDKPFLLSVHLINHYYKDYAIQEQADFYIEVPIKFKPLSVGMVSPDSIDYKEAKQLSFSYNTGNVTIRIPNITYYNLILIEGRPFTPTEEKEAFSIANYLSTPESKSEGAFSSGSIVDSIDSKGSEIFNYLSNDQISTD